MAKKLTLDPINARRGKAAEIYSLPAGRYWTRGADGGSIEIQVSEGLAGVSVRVKRFSMSPDLVISDMFAPRAESDPVPTGDPVAELTVTQYRTDERSPAFARWYRHAETEADIAILGPGYAWRFRDENGRIRYGFQTAFGDYARAIR